MTKKNEAVASLAEGGFSDNEMRTDYARSHVWPGWARISHERTPDVHTLEDVLDLRARVIEAGDRRSAELMRAASTALAGAADKVLDLTRMMREDGQRMRDLEAALRTADENIKRAEADLATLRAVVDGGEVL